MGSRSSTVEGALAMGGAFSCNRWYAVLAGLAALLTSCARAEQTIPVIGGASRAGAHSVPPAGTYGDLLYVNAGCGIPQSSGICIYAFPSGKYMGWVEHYAGSQAIALCSDSGGNVYVTSILAGGRGSAVLVYGHAGNGPTALLRDRNYLPNGCAVDPVSGDLAVANAAVGRAAGNVAIFQKASGKPKFYRAGGVSTYLFCGYGEKGDLFISGASKSGAVAVAKLAKGASEFVKVTFDKKLSVAGPIQWDGERMAFGYGDTRGELIYRTDVSGEKGTVVATTRLAPPDARHAYVGPFWIAGKRIVATFKAPGRYPVAFWRYPEGGAPTKVIRRGRRVDSQGRVTISVPAPR